MKRVASLLFILNLLPIFALAQETTTLMQIAPDAQSAGMAGVGLATTENGSTAIFHNASTILFSQQIMGASYSYADLNKGINIHSGSLFYRIGRKGEQGFALGFRHYRGADFYLEDGPSDHSKAWNIEAAYFRNITKDLSFSVTLRYLQEKADSQAKNNKSLSLDFGTSYHKGMNILNEMASWTVGFQVANVGSKLDEQTLPTRVGLGGSIDLPFSIENRLQVALDVNYVFPSEYQHLQCVVGAEYNFLKYGILHAGYNFSNKNKGIGNYSTLGGGINFWPIRADFSYSLAEKSSLMHHAYQISIGIVF